MCLSDCQVVLYLNSSDKAKEQTKKQTSENMPVWTREPGISQQPTPLLHHEAKILLLNVSAFQESSKKKIRLFSR